MNPEEKEQSQQAEQVQEQKPEAVEEDFLAGAKACDLSGEGTCEACQ